MQKNSYLYKFGKMGKYRRFLLYLIRGGTKNYLRHAAGSNKGDAIHLHTNLKIHQTPKTQQTPHLSHITPSKHHIAPNIVKPLIFQQSHTLNNQIFKTKPANFLPYINHTTSLNTKEKSTLFNINHR